MRVSPCNLCRLWLLVVLLAPFRLLGQGGLVTQAVDEGRRVVLRGNTHPMARAGNDLGEAPAGLAMQRMMLVLGRSGDQEATLDELMEEQQVKGSANYHRWLTPDEFGRRFGLGDGDLAAVTGWLRGHGLVVSGVSRGRTVVEFSGTAGQVEEAFGTSIHQYGVNGKTYWGNASDPSLPAALAGAVKGVVTLHNFPRQSHATLVQMPKGVKRVANGPVPLFTFKAGSDTYYGVGPMDFATIYNVAPLWTAGIDGTGQTIAIVGQSNINLTDVAQFRSLFGLPVKAPVVILNGPDPGVDGDEPEAVLDVSWSGAVARGATIDLVVSATTNAALGVDLSAEYIVDNNLAPVLSESYGICESALGSGGNAFYNVLWQQAAAQGITVAIAAGDGGAAGCDDFNTETAASEGVAVSGFASTPYNVAVGGTDFDQTAATAGNYWAAANTAGTESSAKGYIPETTWNDSCAAAGAGGCAAGTTGDNIVAGSGGRSACATSVGGVCAGYPKPAWQTGLGVPADGVRDLPDVSLFASNGANGSFYIMCEADLNFLFGSVPCSLANDLFVGIGGTSAAAPAFAGVMALVNAKMSATEANARQGNANYVLYKMAAGSGASCNSTTAGTSGGSCVFYDVTKGNDSVPCYAGTANCGAAPAGGYGVLIDPRNVGTPAFTTSAGYDLATGLGSLNANNLVNAWASASFAATTTTLVTLTPTSSTHGQAVSIEATVAAKAGGGVPTGSVALMAAPASGMVGVASFSLSGGVALGSTAELPGGTYNVTAHYAGDGVFGASDSAPVQVTVAKQASQVAPVLATYNRLTGAYTAAASVPYGSIYELAAAVTAAGASGCGVGTAGACPTGTVSFANGGAVLDAGSYGLNSGGTTEDEALFAELVPGTYAITAQYGGDASFSPSTGTLGALVTPGVTSIPYMEVPGTGPTSLVFAGQSFGVLAPVETSSVLAAPTGTVTFAMNGAPAPGTVSYYSYNGGYPSGTNFGYYDGTLTTSIETAGTYTFTSSYSGDSRYAGSQSQFPAVVTVMAQTFQIASPIPGVTIAAPGQGGTAQVTITSVDSFGQAVNVTCAVPAAMTQATCGTATANLANVPSATVQLAITTAAPQAAMTKPARGGVYAAFAGLLLIGVFGRRRRLPVLLALVVLACVPLLNGCGGSGSAVTPPPPVGGTPAGTYTVGVTATSSGITRTGTFVVTVQ
jgi:hypothetical protein